MNWTRRQVLLGAAALAMAPRAEAFGSLSEINIAELDLQGTTSRLDAWERLLHEVQQTTSVETNPKPVRIDPKTGDLFKYPFAVLTGTAAFSMPDDKTLEQLSRYLSYGGFLFCDDSSGADGSGFDRSVRKLAEVLFPTRPLTPIPSDHSLYRAFFLISRPVGRITRHAYLEGITAAGMDGQGGYSPLIYCRNDLSGALDRGPDGRHRQTCTPGGETQRREAVKLGINLILYCLTSDYKKDQAHVKALMESHRMGVDWDSP